MGARQKRFSYLSGTCRRWKYPRPFQRDGICAGRWFGLSFSSARKRPCPASRLTSTGNTCRWCRPTSSWALWPQNPLAGTWAKTLSARTSIGSPGQISNGQSSMISNMNPFRYLQRPWCINFRVSALDWTGSSRFAGRTPSYAPSTEDPICWRSTGRAWLRLRWPRATPPKASARSLGHKIGWRGSHSSGSRS